MSHIHHHHQVLRLQCGWARWHAYSSSPLPSGSMHVRPLLPSLPAVACVNFSRCLRASLRVCVVACVHFTDRESGSERVTLVTRALTRMRCAVTTILLIVLLIVEKIAYVW